jgi:drug/metabolite transporter (DMT)-like permease
VLPVVLGLSAATCIGFSNIVAGLTARRLTPLSVGFWSQATGTVWCALLILVLRPPLVSGQISGGLLAGLAGGAGMVLFYQSMTTGAISLVAPITACSVVFPVIYAIASGETPTLPIAAGLVAIIGGILLASVRPAPVRGDPPDSRIATDSRAIALAIVAAAAFGAFFILIDFAPPVSG